MLTLNEIRNVNFRKSNFGGYRAEDVEAFIDEVQLSYDSLLKENAELLKRLESLTAKLEEYQREEDSIRNALMNAQKLGDASLRESKHKAEIILKDATIKAEKIVSNAQVEIHRERDVIERMQRDIADFKARLLRAYKEHLTLINGIPNEDIMRQDTKDAVASIPMLDRDPTPYAASAQRGSDYGQEDYMRSDRRSADAYDGGGDYAPSQGRQSDFDMGNAGYGGRDSGSFGRDVGAADVGGDQPVMPRERMNQSKGGFTVNIDDGMPSTPTTTLPPPAREQKFASFDSAASYGDQSAGMGGFDRGGAAPAPMNTEDFSASYDYSDPSSLMGGGGDFRSSGSGQGTDSGEEGGGFFRRRR